jgi:glycopeptide antibiotics resistance protein
MSQRKTRLVFALCALGTIPLGLATRPLKLYLPQLGDALGDALWTVMVAFLCAMLLPQLSAWRVGLMAFVISAMVEVSQLYSEPRLDAFRHTTIGHLMFGNGFDPLDFLWYALGALFAILLCGKFSPLRFLLKCGTPQNINLV